MTCPIYELSDLEITTITANFLLLDNVSVDLKALIGQLPIVNLTPKNKVLAEIARLDVALDNLRPLAVHLYELQKKGES